MNIWIMLLVQAILIFLNAVFACAEIAVISVNETKLDHLAEQGNKNAKKLNRLIRQPARFLATIQVAITLSGFLGSALAADHFAEPLANWLRTGMKLTFVDLELLETICVILITLILSYVTLVFGELVPKRVAQRKSEDLALRIAPMISIISKLFSPIVGLLTVSTNGVLRLIGIDPNATEETVSEEDIRMMADAGSKKGLIDEEENEIIQNVFEFDDIVAGQIATHRTEVVFLRVEESDEEWFNTIRDSRHTMYPICDGSPDNIVGVLNTKDYFRLENRLRGEILEKAVRPAYFVPDTVTADVLFRNMKEKNTSIAIVLDEYGGMEGIVTVNDLIECLVGDLTVDDASEEELFPAIEKIDEDVWRIRGEATVEEIEKELEIDLPEGDFDTFNGLVFFNLDEIPKDGSEFDVEIENLKISVKEVLNHQVETAIVHVSRPTSSEDDGEE
jgi:putative hemolysin